MLKRALGVSYAEYTIVGFFAVVLGATSLMTLGGEMDSQRDDLQIRLDPGKVAKLEEKYRLEPPQVDGSFKVRDTALPYVDKNAEKSRETDTATRAVYPDNMGYESLQES